MNIFQQVFANANKGEDKISPIKKPLVSSIAKPRTQEPVNPERVALATMDAPLRKATAKHVNALQGSPSKRKRAVKRIMEGKKTRKPQHTATIDYAAKAARLEKELERMKKQLEELRQRDTLAQMAAEARNMLQKEAVSVPDSVIGMLVSADADKTKKAVSDFASAFKTAVQAAVVEQLKGKPPKTGGSKSVTKADIMKVQNRAERQKLIRENKDLFQ